MKVQYNLIFQKGAGTYYNMPFVSVGYRNRNQNDKLAATVPIMDRGTVYIAKKNPERFLMANTCAVILLQQIGNRES